MSSQTDVTARIDKWLWCVRLFSTRGLATQACRAGCASIGGQVVKPAREVKPGELITVKQGLVLRTLRVLAVPVARLGAKRVAEFCEDMTPPGEFEKIRLQRVQHLLAREKGAGRPTKKDRRAIDRLLEA